MYGSKILMNFSGIPSTPTELDLIDLKASNKSVISIFLKLKPRSLASGYGNPTILGGID